MAKSSTTVSQLQRRVFEALRRLGRSPELETLTDDGFSSIDISLAAQAPGGERVAVEVDGPSHFTSSGSPKGSTLLRNFLLERRGWRVVCIAYTHIDAASTDALLDAHVAAALRA